MIRLIDNNKAVEISIRGWDEENSQYGPDQSADFFELGGLETVSEPELAYIVDNVDYRIGQALDMEAGEGRLQLLRTSAEAEGTCCRSRPERIHNP